MRTSDSQFKVMLRLIIEHEEMIEAIRIGLDKKSPVSEARGIPHQATFHRCPFLKLSPGVAYCKQKPRSVESAGCHLKNQQDPYIRGFLTR